MKNNSKITTVFVDVGRVMLNNGGDHAFSRQTADKFHCGNMSIGAIHHKNYSSSLQEFNTFRLSID